MLNAFFVFVIEREWNAGCFTTEPWSRTLYHGATESDALSWSHESGHSNMDPRSHGGGCSTTECGALSRRWRLMLYYTTAELYALIRSHRGECPTTEQRIYRVSASDDHGTTKSDALSRRRTLYHGVRRCTTQHGGGRSTAESDALPRNY